MLQDVAQRVGPHRVSVVRRHDARRHVEHGEDRRVVERPRTGQDFERPTAQRAQQRRIGNLFPEALERFARAVASAGSQAVDHHGRVHGARRGARDAVVLEPWLFEQPVEHAPREGAVRTTALQSEVHPDRISFHRFLPRVRRRADCLRATPSRAVPFRTPAPVGHPVRRQKAVVPDRDRRALAIEPVSPQRNISAIPEGAQGLRATGSPAQAFKSPARGK